MKSLSMNLKYSQHWHSTTGKIKSYKQKQNQRLYYYSCTRNEQKVNKLGNEKQMRKKQNESSYFSQACLVHGHRCPHCKQQIH